MENPNGAARFETGSGSHGISSRRRTRATQRQFIWCLLLLVGVVSRAVAAPIELMSAKALAPYSLPGASIDAPFRARLSESFGRLPLMFETTDNTGAEFVCRGSGYCLFLSPTEAVLKFKQKGEAGREMRDGRLKLRGRQFPAARPPSNAPEPAPLRIKLVGANTAARGEGLEPLATKVNYFLGNDPKQWRTSVPTFGRVGYQNVYPGIDLVYYGNQRQLEYDFVVAPGADLKQIALDFQAAGRIEIDRSGDLVMDRGGVPVRQRKPIVFQELNGVRREIDGRYVFRQDDARYSVSDARRVGFEVGAYDETKPLVIDPVLVYSTYLGGLDFDHPWDIAVETNGCVYVVGETVSTNFPTAAARYSTNSGGLSDVFLAKLGPAGTNLIYSTYLGGNGADVGLGIALDGSGNVYLTGLTASTNFPVTTNAISTKLNSSAYFGYYTDDAFVTKLDASGTNLLYSTFLGGGGPDEGNAIALDGSGNIYVAGDTASADFPTNETTAVFGGGYDAFLVKLNTASTNLIYSTYLGGSGNDYVFGLGLDSSGDAILGGVTTSFDFPITNAFQTNFAGGTYDGFVTKISSDGATRLFSTYLGGDGNDEISRLALDNAGNIYLTGLTTSTNFPTSSALYSTNNGAEDAFVVKFDSTGTNLVYSTYLGGVFNDEGWSIAVDTNGSAYVVGLTSSTNFPTVNAYQSVLGGFNDVFVLKLNSTGTALDYSTYLGGGGTDNGGGIALDGNGNAYVAGITGSIDFPVYPTTNGVQTSYGGGTGDAFVAKLFPRNAELRAEMSGLSEVTILWPYGLPNFELESTDGLAGTNTTWMTVTNASTVVGEDNTVTFSNPTGSMFFRLRRTQ